MTSIRGATAALTRADEVSGRLNAGTRVTEQVYRHQLKPVITKGAETMNTIFGETKEVQTA